MYQIWGKHKHIVFLYLSKTEQKWNKKFILTTEKTSLTLGIHIGEDGVHKAQLVFYFLDSKKHNTLLFCPI